MVSLQRTTLRKDFIMVLSQKAAIFSAITNVCGEIDQSTPVSLTKEQKTAIIASVVEGFKNNEVALSDKAYNKYVTNAADDKALFGYTSGLLNNWMRKDIRLTGGQPHTIKNPGSRNTVVSNLRKLQAQFEEHTNEFMQIQAKIDEKLAESKAKQSKAKPIDYSQIPSDLLEALNLNPES